MDQSWTLKPGSALGGSSSVRGPAGAECGLPFGSALRAPRSAGRALTRRRTWDHLEPLHQPGQRLDRPRLGDVGTVTAGQGALHLGSKGPAPESPFCENELL
jgi:hypothetical protein